LNREECFIKGSDPSAAGNYIQRQVSLLVIATAILLLIVALRPFFGRSIEESQRDDLIFASEFVQDVYMAAAEGMESGPEPRRETRRILKSRMREESGQIFIAETVLTKGRDSGPAPHITVSVSWTDPFGERYVSFSGSGLIDSNSE